MKILTVSDIVERRLYNVKIKEDLKDIDLILSCGDLPFYYLDYLSSMLNVPLYYVFGNHHTGAMLTAHGNDVRYPGGVNLDDSVVEEKGMLIGGFEGCMNYNYGPKQYSDFEMWQKVQKIKPRLWKNKLFRQRYIDIVITHAPPFGIHDKLDICHRGFKSFRTLIDKYQPRYFIHGHIHRYSLQDEWKTHYQNTIVINTYGYRVLEIEA